MKMMHIRGLRAWTVLVFFGLGLSSSGFAQEGKTTGMNEGETVADAAVKENNAMAKIGDVPGLPRVLLLGDSISIAYTLPVRELLKGKANVHRAPVNCQSSKTGLSGTRPGPKSWLGEGKWDVIHFNFGLWDVRLETATGLASVPAEAYKDNLLQIAQWLQDSGAKVIFATTTPVPKSLLAGPSPGPLPPKTRLFEDVGPRNELAVAALKAKGVAIDDLYSVILPVVDKYQRPNDVHYSKEGSELLAKAVAESIERQLP
jgi:acyl-CoA thioesterase-1